jgi:mRNA-degrading endonuclease RelE of RelBE toxin-antitoxin system
MTRRFRPTWKFNKQYKSLDNQTQKQAAKAIELFMKDPAYPSLRLRKIKGTSDFFKPSANMSIRIIVEVTKGRDNNQMVTFYIIGKHVEVFPPK